MLEKLICAALAAISASGVLAAGYGVYQYVANASAEYGGFLTSLLEGGL